MAESEALTNAVVMKRAESADGEAELLVEFVLDRDVDAWRCYRSASPLPNVSSSSWTPLTPPDISECVPPARGVRWPVRPSTDNSGCDRSGEYDDWGRHRRSHRATDAAVSLARRLSVRHWLVVSSTRDRPGLLTLSRAAVVNRSRPGGECEWVSESGGHAGLRPGLKRSASWGTPCCETVVTESRCCQWSAAGSIGGRSARRGKGI